MRCKKCGTPMIWRWIDGKDVPVCPHCDMQNGDDSDDIDANK